MADSNNPISSSAIAPTTSQSTECQNNTGHKQGKQKYFVNLFRPKSKDRNGTNTSKGHSGFGCNALSWMRSGKKGKEEKLDKRPTVKQKKNKAVQGHVTFDRTTNPDFWDRIIKNSILGTGLIQKAVICNRNTFAINAYGPEDFTPSVEQLNKIALLIQSERADYVVTDKEFVVALDKCNFREVTAEQLMLANVTQLHKPQPNQPGLEGDFELGALLAKNSMLVAIYRSDPRISEARKMLCELRDYFYEQGL